VSALTRADGYLFSDGVRDNPHPRQRAQESIFHFLDRVRQPAFERQRLWWEAAFSRYPAGADKKDVGRRFRSDDEAQHYGAAWELAQHELWRRLGWSLTPHPQTPDGRHRDFLVEHPRHHSFYLECAVDLEASRRRNAERRLAVVEEALASVASPDHQLIIDVRSIGDEALATRQLREEAQRALDRIPIGRSGSILDVNKAGWRFIVRAMDLASSGPPAVMQGGGRSLEERLFNPIRGRVVDKAQRSAELDKPFVVALLIIYPFPILSKADVVEEALFGTSVVTLGPTLQPLAKSNRGDGIWFDGNRARRTGVSALLMQQDLWPARQLPTLHLHPSADRPFTAPVPLEIRSYDIADGQAGTHLQQASIEPQELFGVPEEWPGPENWFEGINNDSPLPTPETWTPRIVSSTED
jgi:hypothetical protein